MTGLPTTGAASPKPESGPGLSIPHVPAFETSRLPGLIASALPAAGARATALVLRLADGAEGADDFELVLTGERGETLLRLGRHSDEEVVAVWRTLGASSGLLLMMEHPDGARHALHPQIGRLRLGEIRIRRRHALLKGRRPRFLTRRKTGHLPVRPAVHREREIAAGRCA